MDIFDGCQIERAGGRMQRVVVCVDDTDDLTKATSTGKIAELIARQVSELGGLVRLGVTRHQLLIADDVAYTSHNSAMAFEADVPAGAVGMLRDRAIATIASQRAETSDPGLCVACPPVAGTAESRAQARLLREFGERAKVEYCPPVSARDLARDIEWVSLSEHGGDGSGIVGALAGAGLRLAGTDGRFRGKWNLARMLDDVRELDVAEAVARLSRMRSGPVRIVDSEGVDLPAEMAFVRSREAKPIMYAGALAFVCDVEEGRARPLAKVDLGEIGNGSWNRVCADFEWDNDVEECAGDARSCRNCLHRRWVERGFECAKPTVGKEYA